MFERPQEPESCPGGVRKRDGSCGEPPQTTAPAPSGLSPISSVGGLPLTNSPGGLPPVGSPSNCPTMTPTTNCAGSGEQFACITTMECPTTTIAAPTTTQASGCDDRCKLNNGYPCNCNDKGCDANSPSCCMTGNCPICNCNKDGCDTQSPRCCGDNSCHWADTDGRIRTCTLGLEEAVSAEDPTSKGIDLGLKSYVSEHYWSSTSLSVAWGGKATWAKSDSGFPDDLVIEFNTAGEDPAWQSWDVGFTTGPFTWDSGKEDLTRLPKCVVKGWVSIGYRFPISFVSRQPSIALFIAGHSLTVA